MAIPIPLLLTSFFVFSYLSSFLYPFLPPLSKLHTLTPSLTQTNASPSYHCSAARLLFSPDMETVTDACWALSYLSDGPNERIQAVLNAGVAPRLVELLGSETSTVQTPGSVRSLSLSGCTHGYTHALVRILSVTYLTGDRELSLHCTPLHCTVLHCAMMYCTALHCIVFIISRSFLCHRRSHSHFFYHSFPFFTFTHSPPPPLPLITSLFLLSLSISPSYSGQHRDRR